MSATVAVVGGALILTGAAALAFPGRLDAVPGYEWGDDPEEAAERRARVSLYVGFATIFLGTLLVASAVYG